MCKLQLWLAVCQKRQIWFGKRWRLEEKHLQSDNLWDHFSFFYEVGFVERQYQTYVLLLCVLSGFRDDTVRVQHWPVSPMMYWMLYDMKCTILNPKTGLHCTALTGGMQHFAGACVSVLDPRVSATLLLGVMHRHTEIASSLRGQVVLTRWGVFLSSNMFLCVCTLRLWFWLMIFLDFMISCACAVLCFMGLIQPGSETNSAL